jgi:hypothetical protein
MVEDGAKRFYMRHDGPLEANEVARHAQVLYDGQSRAPIFIENFRSVSGRKKAHDRFSLSRSRYSLLGARLRH